jgi:hypothetical protein
MVAREQETKPDKTKQVAPGMGFDSSANDQMM